MLIFQLPDYQLEITNSVLIRVHSRRNSLSASNDAHQGNQMWELLRDIALSFAPAELRKIRPPASTERLQDIALTTGLLQCLGALVWLVLGGKVFLAQQYAHWSPLLPLDDKLLRGAPFFIFLLSYLLYPMSLALIYFIAEGTVRWLVALINGEVFPSGPVTLVWKAAAFFLRRRAEKLRSEIALPDKVDVFENGERMLISCSFPRPHWNTTITIAIQGENYEVEKSLPGTAPYACLYVLRRAPHTKVRRGYEEYELPGPEL